MVGCLAFRGVSFFWERSWGRGCSMSNNMSDFSKKQECKFCFLPFCLDFWKLFKIYAINSTYFISHLFHQVFKYLHVMSSGLSKKLLPISKLVPPATLRKCAQGKKNYNKLKWYFFFYCWIYLCMILRLFLYFIGFIYSNDNDDINEEQYFWFLSVCSACFSLTTCISVLLQRLQWKKKIGKWQDVLHLQYFKKSTLVTVLFLYPLINLREFKRMCLFSKSFTFNHPTECKSFVYDYVSSFFLGLLINVW